MHPAADPNWQTHLPPYGQPVQAEVRPMRRRRSAVAAWTFALGLGAVSAVAAIAVWQDPRSVGTQLDEALGSVRGVGDDVARGVTDARHAARQASRQALDGAATAVDDSAISLKVKAALAADPALSATRIEVSTQNGIVRLEGPAPDAVARDRATVLAGAPEGVRGVDNRLVLPQPSKVVAVADGVPQNDTAPAR